MSVQLYHGDSMTHCFTYTDFTDMMDDVMRRFSCNDPTFVDGIVANRFLSHDLHFHIERPSNCLDFADVGFTPVRWRKYCREYLDPNLLSWMGNLIGIHRFSESAYFFPQKATHPHGNCVVSMSFHWNPQPTLTMYSRTSWIVPTGYLEMTTAGIVAEYLHRVSGVYPTLHWYASQIQWNYLYAFPVLLKKGVTDPSLHPEGKGRHFYNREWTRYQQYLAGQRWKFKRVNRMFKRCEFPVASFHPEEFIIFAEPTGDSSPFLVATEEDGIPYTLAWNRKRKRQRLADAAAAAELEELEDSEDDDA